MRFVMAVRESSSAEKEEQKQDIGIKNTVASESLHRLLLHLQRNRLCLDRPAPAPAA